MNKTNYSTNSSTESIYSDTITVYTPKGVSAMRVEITRHPAQVEVRLVEKSNLFTVYLCTITHGDFYLYKKEQDILVGYDRFLPVLVRLFYGVARGGGALRAVVAEEGEKGFVLRFVEQGDFRNVEKLTLKFNKPEEHQYRAYLGSLLRKMEEDNIRLIKEKKQVQEQREHEERGRREKEAYLDEENSEMKKRLEVVGGELAALERKYEEEQEEFGRARAQRGEQERENAQLRFELEQFKKGNYKERAQELEEENEKKMEKIRELEEEASGLKDENRRLNKTNREIAEKMEKEFGTKVDVADIKNKVVHMETKMRGLRNELKEKKERIVVLVTEKKALAKQLDSAQNVYNHFYGKKVDEDEKKDMGNISFEPENPPS
ncbi:hypothetical protein ECANGB1_964 [Enterospora canceri]|uniref:Spindle assembly abnormal protein 6 N-terminal domain-containing protein n=1 Tax=Enterospora canceri TaxID=1081671 RepID=A0A1Y1S751_9MICR|nr:hypothetical protein ECANGB1_964 [Enterospora canceri]